MKTIKIGIDARMFSDNFTGIGRYTFELTKRLFEKKLKGVEIEWVLFLNEPEYSQFNFPKNVKKVLVNAKHYSLAEQTKFLQILNKEQCDLVHFTHFNVPILYGGKYVVTIHDTTLSFFPGKKSTWVQRFFYRLVIKNSVKKSAKILAVSENTKQDVIKLFGAAASKIQVVWNGLTDDFGPVSESKKKAIRKKYKISDDFLFYSGVWREHKNIAGLFRAFTELKKSADFSATDLVLTGTPDGELLQLSDELGIKNSVKPVGKIPLQDFAELMGAAKLFVFPSFYEGFGLPPLEAMKAEVPVVASNISAIPEVCGEAAAYFDPYNTEDMVKKICQIFTDSDSQKKLVSAGKKRTQLFSWDKCTEQTWKTYLSVLQ